jgi:preprotein translocase subunit SecA
VVAGYVTGATSDGYPEEWDLDKLWRAFRQLFPVSISVDDVIEEVGGDRAGLSGEFITEAAIADAQSAYQRREEEFGSEVMRELERRVVLSVLDRKWREHLYEMDYLREGIGLRGYGQRDPLVEYQREGYDMFGAMMDGIKEESVGNLFNLKVEVQENPIVEEANPDGGASPGFPEAPAIDTPEAASPPAPGIPGPRAAGAHARGGTQARGQRAQVGRGQQGGRAQQVGPAQQVGAGDGAPEARTGGAHAKSAAGQGPAIPAGLAPRRAQRLEYSAPSVDGGTYVETSRGTAAGDEYSRVGRNDPCPCGSGRKFKRCHGDPRNTP